jgi:hypothetical protein
MAAADSSLRFQVRVNGTDRFRRLPPSDLGLEGAQIPVSVISFRRRSSTRSSFSTLLEARTEDLSNSGGGAH